MSAALRLPPVSARRITSDGVELDLAIVPELLWFQGHFPDFPILPGVVQVDWALHFARAELGLALPAARLFQVKFRSVIQPGDAVTLALKLQPQRKRLSFEYRSGDAVRSIGHVTLAMP